MANFSKKTNRQEIIVVTLIYLIFFIIGIFSYQDFGISVDEWDLRVLGFVNLKYITEIFFKNISVKLDEILLIPKSQIILAILMVQFSPYLWLLLNIFSI